MANKKIKVYIASGWFNDYDEKILTAIEEEMTSHKDIKAYRPRKDGIALTSEQFHDHELRKSVFNSNVENIESADVVVANLDCTPEKLDTGTVWETAYAVAKGIPIVAFNDRLYDFSLFDRLGSFTQFISKVHRNISLLYDSVCLHGKYKGNHIKIEGKTNSPVFICDDTGNSEELVVMLDTIPRMKVVTNPKGLDAEGILDILRAPYIIIPTDTKDSMLTAFMGMAYALGVPVFTYSSKENPLNLMLIFSVVKHISGIEDLKSTLSKVAREGTDSFEEFDTSGVRVY